MPNSRLKFTLMDNGGPKTRARNVFCAFLRLDLAL